MKLTELHIDSFMGLRDLHMELSPGVNLIEGENESGKSSLAAFLKFLFYGLSGNAPKGAISEKAKSIPFDGGRVGGSVTLETDDGLYRIERSLLPLASSLREQCRVIDLKTGEVSRKKTDPGLQFFGVSEEVFENSLFHRTGEMSAGGREMQEAMENILFSADAALGTRKALKRLDDARILLLHKNGRGGRLFMLAEKEADLRRRLSASEETAERVRSLEQELRTGEEKLRRGLAERQRCEDRIRLTDALVKLRRLERRKQAVRAAEDAAADLARFKAQHSFRDFFPTREYEGLLQRRESEYFDCEKERANLQAALSAPQGDVSEDPAEKGSQPVLRASEGEALFQKLLRQRKKSLLCFLLALGALLVGSALGLLPLFLHLSGGRALSMRLALIPCAGAGVLFLILSLLAHRAGKKHLAALLPSLPRFDRPALEEQIQRLREAEREEEQAQVRRKAAKELQTAAVKAAETKSADILAALNDLAGKWGLSCTSAEEIPSLLSQVRETLAEKERLEEALLRAEAVTAADEEEWKDAPEEEAQLRSLVASLQGVEPISKNDYPEFQKKYNFYRQTTDALEKKLSEQEKQSIELRAGMEDPLRLRETLSALSEEKERLQTLHDAYLLAYQKLEEASAGLRERVSPLLAEEASAFLSAATEGKYSSLLVDRSLSIFFTAQGGTRESDYFSHGTRTLSYLGLRLALVKLLYRCKPPLLFDESFACLDDRRFTAMLKGLLALLKEGGVTEQIFLLTSQTRDLALCRAVLGECLHLHRL